MASRGAGKKPTRWCSGTRAVLPGAGEPPSLVLCHPAARSVGFSVMVLCHPAAQQGSVPCGGALAPAPPAAQQGSGSEWFFFGPAAPPRRPARCASAEAFSARCCAPAEASTRCASAEASSRCADEVSTRCADGASTSARFCSCYDGKRPATLVLSPGIAREETSCAGALARQDVLQLYAGKRPAALVLSPGMARSALLLRAKP